MIIVDIERADYRTKEGEKDGKPWKMHFQQIVISGHFVDGFPARHPRESTIQLDEKNPQPYAVGRYVISPEAFYFGDFGSFRLGRMRLQPLEKALAELADQVGVKISALKAAA